MKLDILVLAAHPDDAELGCAGTIISHIAQGKKVGVVDYTRGELGTRGTPEKRLEEAKESSKLMGLTIRENLNFKDGFFVNDEKHQMAVIRAIRQYKPDIVLANAVSDRHPDHGKAAQLATDACFYSGLMKIESEVDGQTQEAWRPKAVYHYIQSRYIVPDIVVDISGFWQRKMEAVLAYKSQFHNPDSNEPGTFISSPEFLLKLEARAKELGHAIGVEYGEGYTNERYPGVKDLSTLL